MFDVIDDVMLKQNTNEDNIDEEGLCIEPKFDVLFEELNTESTLIFFIIGFQNKKIQ